MLFTSVREDNLQALASELSYVQVDNHGINRGSYMSAHVLLNLLNELRKK